MSTLANREIGVAIGVLMHEHRLSQAQAFDVLRAASQDSNRRLADIALEVVTTGTLNIRGWPARGVVLEVMPCGTQDTVSETTDGLAGVQLSSCREWRWTGRCRPRCARACRR